MEMDPEHEQTIDWNRLRRTILNMSHAFGTPMAFKAVLAGWHAKRLQECLARALFVRVRRDPAENAISLMRMRREYLGSYEKWLSLKPREYAWLRNEPVWSQVAGQVYFLERTMTGQLQGTQTIELQYEEICRDARSVLECIGERLGGLRPVSLPPSTFPIMSATTGSVTLDRKIRAAAQEFYSG
jgi:hypothetical protein